ncbi:hypothetical protein LCGC14_0145350 [marine sediment metagenome]|uniref:HNH nuclease domain-containing protein n=1 Tax=marine sediment metagenome TaxID=412755 RepID=A0A0F9UZS1_9ZZZZ
MAYKDKEKQKQAAKQHYEANKEIYKERSRLSKRKQFALRKKFIADYLSQHPCVDCGFSDIRALDFDHVRGEKEDSVSNLVKRCVSMNRIRAEIEKCEIRCANCHRIRTHKTLWEKKVE